MDRPALPDDSCPLEFSRRLFKRWRADRADAAEPVPPPLVEIARTLLRCFTAADIGVALDVPVSLLGVTTDTTDTTDTTAFVALPSASPANVVADPVAVCGNAVDLDELVIDRPDGTRIRLRGRLPVDTLGQLLHAGQSGDAR